MSDILHPGPFLGNLLPPDRSQRIAEIREWLELLHPLGDVFEVRAIDAKTQEVWRPHVESGYFNSAAAAAELTHQLSANAGGTYVTFNRLDPNLLFRAVNRFRPIFGRTPTTSDGDVERR